MALPSNPLSLPTVPVTPSAGGFLRLLAAGLPALLLRPARPGSVSTAAGHCILLVLLVTAVSILGERWMLGAVSLTFNWSTLRESWFDLPILLLGGAWMVQSRPTALTRPMPLLHFAVVMISASVWLVAIAYALFFALVEGWLPGSDNQTFFDWIYFGAPVWSFLVAIATIRGMNRFSPIPAMRRLAVRFVLAVVTAWYLAVPSDSYWQVPEGEEPEQYVGIDAQHVLARIPG